MRVAGQHDVVGDVVLVQGREGAVAVGHVAVPGVVVEGQVHVVADDQLAEDGLVADEPPLGAALGGLFQGAVEPGFLPGAHQGAGGVVGDGFDVFDVLEGRAMKVSRVEKEDRFDRAGEENGLQSRDR